MAGRCCQPPSRRSSGTTMIPPPTPNTALKKPATSPIRTSCNTRCLFSRLAVDTGILIRRLAERPSDAALLLDVDGTLAPIVERPEDATVPMPTRTLLRELAAKYALVACISGRPEPDARRVVGVEELVYLGEHGLGLDPADRGVAAAHRGVARGDRVGRRAEAVVGGLSLPHRLRRAGGRRRAPQGRAAGGGARPAASLGQEGARGAAARRARTRERPSAPCSASEISAERCTPATTPPTSTLFGAWTASSWR